MSVQDTSIDTYYDILASGVLGKRQTEVYSAFKRLGDMTNNELSNFIQLPINVVTARTNELVKLGLIEEKYQRASTITGRRSIVWGLAVKQYTCKACGVSISKEQAERTFHDFVRALCERCEGLLTVVTNNTQR